MHHSSPIQKPTYDGHAFIGFALSFNGVFFCLVTCKHDGHKVAAAINPRHDYELTPVYSDSWVYDDSERTQFKMKLGK